LHSLAIPDELYLYVSNVASPTDLAILELRY